MPERVRFFPGQILAASDFQIEQAYHINMRRLHNRWLHGPGVVQGLNVSVTGPPVGSVLVVSPGFALDGLGREIVVETTTQVNLSAFTNDVCFITLRYIETEMNPVPLPDGQTQFSRLKEGFSVSTAAKEPNATSDLEILGIARAVRHSGHWSIDESYHVRRPHTLPANSPHAS